MVQVFGQRIFKEIFALSCALWELEILKGAPNQRLMS